MSEVDPASPHFVDSEWRRGVDFGRVSPSSVTSGGVLLLRPSRNWDRRETLGSEPEGKTERGSDSYQVSPLTWVSLS